MGFRNLVTVKGQFWFLNMYFLYYWGQFCTELKCSVGSVALFCETYQVFLTLGTSAGPQFSVAEAIYRDGMTLWPHSVQ